MQPKVLAMVQGDISTTMLQPLEELGAICEKYGVLFYSDATASNSGNPFLTDEWQLDAVSIGLQKCLCGPSGSAPVTLSEQAVAAIRKRKHIGTAIRNDRHVDSSGRRIASNYFDLGRIMDYWGERLNHHTKATTMLYGARECMHFAGGRRKPVQRTPPHSRSRHGNLHRRKLVIKD